MLVWTSRSYAKGPSTVGRMRLTFHAWNSSCALSRSSVR